MASARRFGVTKCELSHSECLQAALQAKESYQRAVDLEPDDAHLLEALQRADVAERKEAEQKKHKFKRKDASVLQADKSTVKKQKQAPQSGLLSFDEDEA